MNDLLQTILLLMCNDDFCFCNDPDRQMYGETIDFGIEHNYDNIEMALKELPKGCRKKLRKL